MADINILKGFLNTELALQYCGEMEELYLEMLGDYVKADKRGQLDSLLAAGNLGEYRIQVHALKSTSLMVGAEEVSAKAKELEMAAAEENVNFLNDNHSKVMEMYGELLNKISAAL